jgi:6-phosphofructokinase 1
MKCIGVLTSGGDVPGLNACIRAVTRTALAQGVTVMGVQHGYAGLMHGEMIELDSRTVGGIMQRGGTFLGTARSPAFETLAGQQQAAAQIARAGIEGLVIVGGNGSLCGALALHELGVPVIGVPKTIDNDQYGTDIAIGVDTALNTIVDAIGRVKDTASSHHRAFLIETMGRNCGYLALASSLISGAELALVPEHPVTPEAVAHVIERAYRIGKSHCIIVVAEGWKPGLRALQAHLRQNNRDEGFDVREVVLGHVQRGGTPTAFDRMLGTRLGAFATERLLDGSGAGMLAGWHGNRPGLMPLREAVAGCHKLDPELLRLAEVLAV